MRRSRRPRSASSGCRCQWRFSRGIDPAANPTNAAPAIAQHTVGAQCSSGASEGSLSAPVAVVATAAAVVGERRRCVRSPPMPARCPARVRPRVCVQRHAKLRTRVSGCFCESQRAYGGAKPPNRQGSQHRHCRGDCVPDRLGHAGDSYLSRFRDGLTRPSSAARWRHMAWALINQSVIAPETAATAA